MLKTFKYTKANGETSTRTVYPLRIVDDKMLSIDLTSMTDEERMEAVVALEAIHRQYLNAIKEAGFASNYRYFFIDSMEVK